MPKLEEQVRRTRPDAGEEIEIYSEFFGSSFKATMPDTDDEFVVFIDPRGPRLEEEQECDGKLSAIAIRIKFEEQ